MSGLSDFLVESILNESVEQVTALFGGGFKPPTKGHLDVILNGLKQNPEINNLRIIVGGGVRDGITQDQSAEIWNFYNDINLIPINTEIIKASPFSYYKEYLKSHPEDKVYVFIGSREDDDKDQMDVAERSKFVKKYSNNVIPVEISTTGGVSGTEARKLFKSDLDSFKNMLPQNLTDDDVKKVINILNNNEKNIPDVTSNKTEPLKPINEADPKKGTGKKPKGSSRRLYTDEDPKDTVGVKFSTRQDIVDTLNKKSFKAKSHARQSQVINLIHQRVRAAYGRAKDPAVKKRLKSGLDYITNKKEASKKKTQRLKDQKENIDPKSQAKHKGKSAPFGSAYEPLNENATYSSKIDYKQQIKDLTKHMLDKGMNIQPLPKVIFKHGDQENASQFLGKTAYYDPNNMTVVLYTEGRHPKDIVRSFAHEMIHHIQNLEDRLGGINTTNTMEDDNLNDIEREAYTKGNMTFRNWTDNKDGEEVTSLNEGPQFGILYHYTEYLSDVLDDNMLRGPISLTRSRDSFVKDWIGNVPILVLDKDKLRTNYKIRPYQSYDDNGGSEDEMEEVIDRDVTNLSKYIIKVVLPKSNEEYENALKEKGIPYEITKPLNEKTKDPFGLDAYARELVKEFQIEDIKPPAKSLEKQKEVRIFTKNCDCDKT